MRFFLFLLIALRLTAAAPEYTVVVVRTYPHDRAAFTQGFEYHNGKFYEGTGLEGRSTVRIDDVLTGKVLQSIPIPRPIFGEGITVMNDRIIEITWLSHVGFTYRRSDLARTGEFRYEGEGWGLANDGKQVYFSDGSAQIRILDPVTLKEIRRITVRDQGGEHINMLNELEWVKGELWANVWQTDRIVRISPFDGSVLGWIDASALVKLADDGVEPIDVLNGIAFDSATGRIFLTGKLWPKIFEVQIVPKASH